MRENTDQINSEYRYFSRSGGMKIIQIIQENDLSNKNFPLESVLYKVEV